MSHIWLASFDSLTIVQAAPFHPKGMAPRAPCPKCLKDKGDETPKNLYGIRGLGEGEYDPMIPSEWRRCPAIKLDSSTPEISAVRVSDGSETLARVAINRFTVSIYGSSPLLATSPEALEECTAEAVDDGRCMLERTKATSTATIRATDTAKAIDDAGRERSGVQEMGGTETNDIS